MSQKRLTTFVSLRFIHPYAGCHKGVCNLCKGAKLVKFSRPAYHLSHVWDFYKYSIRYEFLNQILAKNDVICRDISGAS